MDEIIERNGKMENGKMENGKMVQELFSKKTRWQLAFFSSKIHLARIF